jgi:hypothetical protein
LQQRPVAAELAEGGGTKPKATTLQAVVWMVRLEVGAVALR